jgi:putative nucleotidyltransferase with HDIG domain
VRDLRARTARAPPRRGSGLSAPLDAARETLAGTSAWLVGGAVRDRLLGRDTGDVDVALEGDPRRAARAIARATGGAAFQLSGAHGAWRVVGPGPGHTWHVDLVTLREGGIDEDLAHRDFTINAMAEPLAGGELLDPHGGRADLAARRLRMVGPAALAEDPLRTLRAVRQAVELALEIEPATLEAVRANTGGLERVSPERIFGELKRVVGAEDVRRGLALMDTNGLTAAVLPELPPLRGVAQSVYHHADVHEHTLQVLDAVVALERDPAASGLGELDETVRSWLARPLADELTHGGAMRWAALLHDVAKPQTRIEREGGVVGFPGHDEAGAAVARSVLRRLRASKRTVDYVATLTRNHLRLGFLVHRRPLSPRDVWRYLRATAPYSPDVTLLTVADRLATRGRKAEPAIAAHLEVARQMLAAAFAEDAAGPRAPLWRGDELARELGITPGPWLGELLAELEEDRYAGDIATREDALRRAREIAERRG